jgi:hypothetical protein
MVFANFFSLGGGWWLVERFVQELVVGGYWMVWRLVVELNLPST